MFVIAKHKLSSLAIYQRIPAHESCRMKDKGVVVFEDERMAEYAVCYMNKVEPITWTRDIDKHGDFEYDIKQKKELFVVRDYIEFNRQWVAFMVNDISFQLRRRGVDKGKFLLCSSPYDLPLTPWVIVKISNDSFFLMSTSDGRIVGGTNKEMLVGYNKFIANVGGVLCGAHLDILTFQDAI